MKPRAGVCRTVYSEEKRWECHVFLCSQSKLFNSYLKNKAQVILIPYPCQIYLYLCTFYSLTMAVPQRELLLFWKRYPGFFNFSSEKIKTLTSHKLTSENVNVTLFPKPLSPLNANCPHSSSPDLLLPAPQPLCLLGGDVEWGWPSGQAERVLVLLWYLGLRHPF